MTEADGSVLLEAQGLVYGAREEDYAPPSVDFARTAAIWTALGFQRQGRPIAPEDIGLAMIGLKLSRLAHRLKRDSLVDVAGYAETVRRVMDAQRG